MTNARDRNAQQWADWFWAEFFPDWLALVQDGQDGVIDALDVDEQPCNPDVKSMLAQARMLFAVSHVGLLTGDEKLAKIADQIAEFLERFLKDGGLYRNRLDRRGCPTGKPADEIARSYDHSFVILALVTWNKMSPKRRTRELIDDCWFALMKELRDPGSSLLRNDDTGISGNSAQNPHMHLYEACLQAFRMTGDDVWMVRAADLRAVGLSYFLDTRTGSIAEFIAPDGQALPGAAGTRREIGHQCEWAWLLSEEARLGGPRDLITTANRLFEFADLFGFFKSGPLEGAVVDAVSADGNVVESSFLLWPQTEAIKILAVRYRAGDTVAGERACALMCTMFRHWFKGRASFVNQLDAAGNTLWPQALTRLMYHIVLAMTEGAKAGLWAGPVFKIADKSA